MPIEKNQYFPKIVQERKAEGEPKREFVLLDNVFKYKETIAYAVKHNFDIRFVCGTYTCATEILCYIQENGYELVFEREPVYMHDTILYYNFVVACYKKDK